MTIIEQINQESSQLPGEAQQEVLDFIRALRTRKPVAITAETEEDEVTNLLHNPLMVKGATVTPLTREEVYAR